MRKGRNKPRQMPGLHYTYNKMFDWTRMGLFRFNEGSQSFALMADQPWPLHRDTSMRWVKQSPRPITPTRTTVGKSSQRVFSTSVEHPTQVSGLCGSYGY
jgi:hypothetical protein